MDLELLKFLTMKMMALLLSLTITFQAFAQNNLDWTSIGQILHSFEEEKSLTNLKDNIKLFLLSAPVEALRLAQTQKSCQVGADVVSKIAPEFTETLFEELVKNFPFFKPQISGCNSNFLFYCNDPLYTVLPNRETIADQIKWEALARWTNGETVDTPEMIYARSAFKAYTLINSLAACQLPRSAYGKNADTYGVIWKAVEYSINPNWRPSPNRGYIMITAGKDMLEIVQWLEVVDKYKKSLK